MLFDTNIKNYKASELKSALTRLGQLDPTITKADYKNKSALLGALIARGYDTSLIEKKVPKPRKTYAERKAFIGPLRTKANISETAVILREQKQAEKERKRGEKEAIRQAKKYAKEAEKISKKAYPEIKKMTAYKKVMGTDAEKTKIARQEKKAQKEAKKAERERKKAEKEALRGTVRRGRRPLREQMQARYAEFVNAPP